jgi:predicted MFS family arabinose efflux permease
LALILTALAGGHLALAAAAGNVFALGAVLFVAGAAIAPVFASVFAKVDRVAPAGAVTEGFAWLNTAGAIGGAAGAAIAGAVADSAGPTAAFVLAGGAGVVAVVVTLLRVSSLVEHDAPVLTASSCDARLAAA